MDVKIDDQLSERTHAFGRYSYFGNGTSSATIFGKGGGQGFSAPGNTFGGTASGRSQSAVFGMDIALSPKLLTDFRLGYLRYHVKTQKYDGEENLASRCGNSWTQSWRFLHRRCSRVLYRKREWRRWRWFVELRLRAGRERMQLPFARDRRSVSDREQLDEDHGDA